MTPQDRVHLEGLLEVRLRLVLASAEEARAWKVRRDEAIRNASRAGASLRAIAEAAEMSVGGIQAILERAD